MNRSVMIGLGVLLVLSFGVTEAAEEEVVEEVAEETVGEHAEYRVPLQLGRPYIHVLHEGRSIRVERIQDPGFELKGYFARTSRNCPPFCLNSMEVDPDVKTVGEIEVFDFMDDELRDGAGMIIDARTPEWYRKGTIPGAVNYPFSRLDVSPDDPSWEGYFADFGAKPASERGIIDKMAAALGLSEESAAGEWDFGDAKTLLVFCNGPVCGQSARAISGLLEVGYPPEKLLYYRGGMQMWELWGLTTVIPAD